MDWCTDWFLNVESHVQARLCLLDVAREPRYVTGCALIEIQPKLLKKTKRPDASGLGTCIKTSVAWRMISFLQ
jgi:hypothetical protein